MNINNVKGMMNYNNVLHGTNNKSKFNSISNQFNHFKDAVELSSTGKTVMETLDKGTAIKTTLYVDSYTYNQILNYTTNNPECQWSEMGFDGEKRWVVVNGQRFECPLSEKEKAARKRAQLTLLDYMEEHRLQKEKTRLKHKKYEQIDIDFTGTSNASILGIDPKIDHLLSNEKAINMLKDISKYTNGKISLSSNI
ncbi:hypothetical protein V2H29_21775 [Lysinibacillus fusiformis]|uniref:hypothetical protein n=1 Tax=Lysinibacillus TaxID=400634 RepID=UPI00232E59AE|nr:hypothetical protein [Lysinibacillus sp. OF-1]MEE3809572.1 hypothetical protein [Lysinibacillus fusiformis]WCH49690.1 hypothetical protein NV349_10025 [Lysinibacillus sp. OF-1]